jgi:hypothetical protein
MIAFIFLLLAVAFVQVVFGMEPVIPFDWVKLLSFPNVASRGKILLPCWNGLVNLKCSAM